MSESECMFWVTPRRLSWGTHNNILNIHTKKEKETEVKTKKEVDKHIHERNLDS